ncbi:hypothetical protein [Erwinia tasmaniensis]|uniref:hypothetical protein n=1 Tax=Erwinia tasmaniensis TaxID=338565 RepID=UPI003A4D71C0
MTLLELLVKELPKRGGWPESKCDVSAVQDKDNEVKFHYTGKLLKFGKNKAGVWGSNSPDSWLEINIPGCSFHADKMADDFSTAIVTREQYEAALAASQQPVWSGEGFPPVGVECESAQPGQINWAKFKVVAVESGSVFGFWDNGISSALDGDKWLFRPIRSEAERKREEVAIAHMKQLNIGDCEDPQIIYDAIAAGKIPGIRLTDE